MSELSPHRVLEVNNKKLYAFPRTGTVTIPAVVNIPSEGDSRKAILEVGQSLGFRMPKSFSKAQLISRIKEILILLGYSPITASQFSRSSPLQLHWHSEEKEKEDIPLPETIDIGSTEADIMQTILTLHLDNFINLDDDVRTNLVDFLTARGYGFVGGKLYRKGGLILHGGYPYNKLFSPDSYIQFLTTRESVTITASDLHQLNLTYEELISKLTNIYWQSLPELATEAALMLEIPPSIVELALLITNLPHISFSVHREIFSRLNGYSQDKFVTAGIITDFRNRIKLIPETYDQVSCSNATIDFTNLSTAVAHRDCLNYEDYQLTIDRLLNSESIPGPHREYLVTVIEKFPGIWPIIKTFTGQSLASRLIDLYYTFPPNSVQKLVTYAFNYPLLFDHTVDQVARQKKIAELSKSYINALKDIYQVDDAADLIAVEIHPLEQYVFNLSKLSNGQISQLANKMGMIIPDHLVKREIRNYILDHISEYKEIITRPGNLVPVLRDINKPVTLQQFIITLRYYTDQELVDMFGYMGGFKTRGELIFNIYTSLHEDSFILYSNIVPDYTINTDTTLLTPVADLPYPYIVFGNPFYYRVLELDEFLLAFTEKFLSIGDEPNIYSLKQISQLMNILPSMANINPQLSGLTNQVISLIETQLLKFTKTNSTIDIFRSKVAAYGGQAKESIYRIFYQIFYAGMYMRRWLGPGNNYPSRQAETIHCPYPEGRAEDLFTQIYEALTVLATLNQDLYKSLIDLPEVDYNFSADTTQLLLTKIFDIVKDVSQSKRYIRTSSRRLILSAYYYIGVIFGELISNFDPYSVEPVA